jgi:hypothetical protein
MASVLATPAVCRLAVSAMLSLPAVVAGFILQGELRSRTSSMDEQHLTKA